MTIGFYNYYNIQGRYSPDTPQDRYQQMVDRYHANQNSLHHYNENPYSEENLAIRKLDEYLAPMASEIRSKYSSQDEVREYLSQKYFGTSDFSFKKRWEDPETFAMYENELNATLFGTIGSANRNDPRLEFDESQWSDYIEEEKRQSNNILKNQMQNILEQNNIDIKDKTLLFSFNPYTHSAKATGDFDNETLKKINELINSNNNSKELFYWAFQNSDDHDEYSVAKMRAYNEVLKYTGLNLATINPDEGYDNLLTLIKDGINEDNSIGKEFKMSAFDYVSGLLDMVFEKGFQNIEDLNLNAFYSKEEGFYIAGKIFSA